jgi:hypothetical protein
MLYLLAQYLDFEGPLNLIRYLSFRSGAAIVTALLIGLVIGPRFILMLRMRQGKGQPIHGRADDPDLAHHIGAAVDGSDQRFRLGMPVRHARLRADRVPRRF